MSGVRGSWFEVRAHLLLSFALPALLACHAAGDARELEPPYGMGTLVTAAPAGPPKVLAVPPDSAIPGGALGASIRRGRAILLETADSLPRHSANKLRCVSCHLDDGRRAFSAPYVGVYARFPQYRSRSGTVQVIEDRINDCLERSMNGRALGTSESDKRDLRDIVAYLAFVSQGVAVGGDIAGQGFARLAALAPDTARGRSTYAANCARCHGSNGQGTAAAPPVWGPDSYNIGAGMARLRTAAAFIKVNMPFDRPGTLSDQEAFDVAAYINARPRPDFRGKENDWPKGDPPPDVAYPTRAAKKGSS